MAVYQVAIIFEANHDSKATNLAEFISKHVGHYQEDDLVSNAKISFTKFEKEAEAQ